MVVTVHIPSALRNECGGRSVLNMDPSGPVRLGEILDHVAMSHPRLDRRIRDEQGRLRRYVNVFVDQEECRVLSGMDTNVPDGSEVRILPSVAGG